MTPEQKIAAVEAVMEKYLVPKKEYDGIQPKIVAQAIIDALEPKSNGTAE